MIVTRVKCEVCDNGFPIRSQQYPYEWDVPDTWLTLIQGNPQHNTGLHFCSDKCLMTYLKDLKLGE